MRRILPTILVLALLAGLIRLFRIVQQYDPALERGGAGSVPDVSIQLEDAMLISRRAGKPEWTMKADRIDIHPQGAGSLDAFSSAEFRGISNGILYKGGREEATFSAKTATYDQSAQKFEIRGGLRIRDRKGDDVTADECQWSERDDFVRLPRGARGLFNGSRVSAPFLLFSPKRRLVQCPQGAEGTFEGYPLRAAGLYWDVNAGRVECTGPVAGERRSMSYNVANVVLDLKNHTMQANRGMAELRIGSGEDLEGLR